MFSPLPLTALILMVGLATFHGRPTVPQEVATSEGSSPHAYFEGLIARKDHLVSYSLRDPAQLDHRKNGGFANSNTRELSVTYAPAKDTYVRPQDAAKVVVPAGGNNLRNQVRLPLDHGAAGFLVTWDAWWGEEFAFDSAGIRNYKAFQLESGGRIWTEIRARFQGAHNFPGSLALVDVRAYGGSAERKGSRVGGLNYGGGSLGGLLANFAIAPNTWTRYWVQITPRATGEWWDFSLWLADENRDAVQLYDRVGVKPNGRGWDRLWLEYNTSTSAAKVGRGDLVSYVRNVVVLSAVANPTGLMKRPLVGPSPRPAARAEQSRTVDVAALAASRRQSRAVKSGS